MPFKISNDCINCGICEIICPYNAIYPGGVNWRKIHNRYFTFCEDISFYDDFWSREHYYVVPDKCTECVGKYPQPICKSVCPVKGCAIDKDHWESEEHLYAKKDYLETIPGWR
jgi:ferredoxin